MQQSLLPSSNLLDVSISNNQDSASKTWDIDNPDRQIDGLEAIKQSVLIALSTNRYSHLIYSWNYGQEFKTLIGKDYSYVITEAPRIIKECLEQDERVTNVSNFSFAKRGDSVAVSFDIITIIGQFRSEVIV